MKIAYNILFPIVHVLCVAILGWLGFCRLLVWQSWFWVNELVYVLFAVLVLGGHYILLRRAHRKGLTFRAIFHILRAVDYILFGIHLLGVVLILIGGLGRLSENLWFYLEGLLPIVAVSVAAIAIRHHSTEYYLYICE